MPSHHHRQQQSNGRTPTLGEKPVIYKLGIYGWRKRCLYWLIFVICIISLINLTLIIWMMRALDFGLYGMGKLRITNNGLRMDGVAEFTKILRANSISSRTDHPLTINSRRNLTLSSLDESGQVVGQIVLDSNKIVLKNKELHVKDQKGRTLLYADDEKIKLDIQNMHIIVPGGLKLDNAIHTSSVQGPDDKDLKLESLSHELNMKAGKDVNINSFGADVKIGSLNDIKFTSKKGKVYFDADKIQFKNIPKSTIVGKVDANIYVDVAEVCVCKDGTLFLAPPDSKLPCKVTRGICAET